MPSATHQCVKKLTDYIVIANNQTTFGRGRKEAFIRYSKHTHKTGIQPDQSMCNMNTGIGAITSRNAVGSDGTHRIQRSLM
jgi:hypothetical protein